MATRQLAVAGVRLGFGQNLRVKLARGGRPLQDQTGSFSGNKRVEELWRLFFSDPSQWWDHRADKGNPRFPDFKHKKTGAALWEYGQSNPKWVRAKLAGMSPGCFQKSIFAWNAMLRGHLQHNKGQKVLDLFWQMHAEGVKPDRFTFVTVINACAKLMSLEEGRRIHNEVIQSGFQSHVFVGTSLVNMYVKCGIVEEAQWVFDKMPYRNVVTWTALLSGYVKFAKRQKALELFYQMQAEGVKPDPVIFVMVLKACSSFLFREEGKTVHNQVIKHGCESDVYVGSSLIDMYAKGGSIDNAWIVFKKMPTRNVVSWNAMITGYAKCKQGKKALQLFRQMTAGGMKPDSATFVAVIHACADLAALEEGRRIHTLVIQSGCESDVRVGNSLIDMYVKCRSMEDAWLVFNKLPTCNEVSWATMLSGYVRNEQGQKALEFFQKMRSEGVKLDPGTLVAAINACASLTLLDEGRNMHALAIQMDSDSDVFVGTSLVDMYAKCGSIEDAQTVFNKMPTRNVVSWNAMLGGLAMHGRAEDSFQLFEQMHQEVTVDKVTMVCLLSACSHGGRVHEGIQYFESMHSLYGISPTVKHFVCMVDLLGRAGHLKEAEQMIKKMSCSFKEDASLLIAWKALLGACRNHSNLDIGERAAKQVLKLDPENSSGYALLSNLYAATGHWDCRDKVQQMRIERCVKRIPGLSWIGVKNQVHSFVVDDQSHAQMAEIHTELKRLSEKMKEAGYHSNAQSVQHGFEDEEKIFHAGHHSEKLAIAFGLISTPAGTTLRIFKNSRVCSECHTATKFIAHIVQREVIIRDPNRFHHFKHGVCSCKDYW